MRSRPVIICHAEQIVHVFLYRASDSYAIPSGIISNVPEQLMKHPV